MADCTSVVPRSVQSCRQVHLLIRPCGCLPQAAVRDRILRGSARGRTDDGIHTTYMCSSRRRQGNEFGLCPARRQLSFIPTVSRRQRFSHLFSTACCQQVLTDTRRDVPILEVHMVEMDFVLEVRAGGKVVLHLLDVPLQGGVAGSLQSTHTHTSADKFQTPEKWRYRHRKTMAPTHLY